MKSLKVSSKPPRQPKASQGRRKRAIKTRLKALVAFSLLASSGGFAFVLWPYLGMGAVGLPVWTTALVVALWARPRMLLRVNLWLALLVLLPGISIITELYHTGWGGSVAAVLSRPTPLVGVAVLPFVLLGSAFILAPRATWRWLRATLRALTRAVRIGYRLGRRAYMVLKLVAKALVVAGGFVYRTSLVVLEGLTNLYQRYPLHWLLPVLAWRSARLPYRLWRRLVRGEPVPLWTDGAGGLLPARSGEAPKPRRSTRAAAATPAMQEVAEASESGEEGMPGRGNHSRSVGGWKLPPLTLLDDGEEVWVSEEENYKKARLIEQTLGEYGIEVAVDEIRPGPVVTQFGLVPGWVRRYREVREREKDGRPRLDRFGRPVVSRVEEKVRVKVDSVVQREKDLALALAASSIRIEAPVPGEAFIGVEVPNDRPATVSLRSILQSEAFRSLQRKGYLPIALGKGSGGEPVVADLTAMPHILIAGATGSGKSVCINSIISDLIVQCSPFEVRFLMVDPKRVELTPYNGLPHLLTPVVVEADDTIPLLRGLIGEMKERYKRLEAKGVRNIQTYNQKAKGLMERMPYLVVVIDELADLMMAAPGDVERALCRLAQLGRAVGIHLVVATQRPSVDVITGLIKANFPSRVSFSVSSQVDSRTILDGVGAEKLLGRGDMLFLPLNYVKPKRMQGVFISDEEIHRLVEAWKGQAGNPVPPIPLESAEDADEGDELLERAKALAERYHRLSVSMLQRRLGIGYPRAARLLDRLEELGVVAAGDPGKSREVVVGGAGGRDDRGDSMEA
ncbi:MAG: DNA translocase FtsK [Chloroflexi bacterium]|nr:DNA translocase FtsK [Chloroflexota bacterium]